MLRLRQSKDRWWQKPLAEVAGRALPAELVVLRETLRRGEAGVWLNSRGTTSGVTDLVRGPDDRLKTVRGRIPPFVTAVLTSLLEQTGLAKGAPDLVVWNESTQQVRFIEVKCPHWDRPSAEQRRFLEAAEARGISTSVVEWEFENNCA
jgi:hypothetical protein